MVNVLTPAPGVRFDHLTPAGLRILAALDNATRLFGVDLVITCGSEGHPPDDPHSLGRAMDVRVNNLSPLVIAKVHAYLQQVLIPAFFTVLLETPTGFEEPELAKIQYVNVHATGPHLHVQQRKGVVYPPVDATGALHA